MPDIVRIPGLARDFEWLVEPVAWEVLGPDALSITAWPNSDLFVSPDGSGAQRSAAMLVTQVGGDFLFSARVGAAHRSLFDAGVLVLWAEPGGLGQAVPRAGAQRPADGRLGGHAGPLG